MVIIFFAIRVSVDPVLLERSKILIRKHYNASVNFEPQQLLIVTWERVGHYNSGSDLTNTFQTVLVTDGIHSFVIFQYSELQWIESEPKYPEILQQR